MTQQDILKMVGVKTPKELYTKFPTHESFMAKYGKQIKKAQSGNLLNGFIQDVSGAQRNIGGDLTRQENLPMMQGKGFSSLPVPALQNQQLAPWTPPTPKQSPDLSKLAGPAAGMAKGVISFLDEIKQKKKAEQNLAVSDKQLEASRTKDVDVNRQTAANMTKKRQMMMPINTGEEFFPIYGVGTEPLAKSGKKVKGQIANTYAPKTLYDDLGYEPLKAANGFMSYLTGAGSGDLSQAAGMAFNNNAGSQMGEGVGKAMKMIPGIGSVAGALAAPVLSAIGGGLDAAFGPAGKIKKANKAIGENMGMMGMQGMGQGIQQQNSSFMKEGGWVSHDWQPQVITNFGEHSMKNLLRPDPTMDTLRAGGHLQQYTPPTERAMEIFDMGGDLQVHSGGYMEPLSNNPYAKSPTVMFRGQSHDESDGRGRTGIRMTYGNSGVEVERGEPAQEFADGGQTKSLVVFGNLPISNILLPLLGDPDAKGKNFKNYVNYLSKKEKLQEKVIYKSTKAIDNFNPRSPFERLTFASHAANIKGADMNQKDIIQKKETAAALQQAVKDTADKHGIISYDLAKGNIKYAKLGTTLHKAAEGDNIDYGGLELISTEDHDRLSTMYDAAKKQGKGPAVLAFQKEFTRIAPRRAQAALKEIGMGATNYAKSKRPELGAFDPSGNLDSYFEKRTEGYKSSLDSLPVAGEQITLPEDTTLEGIIGNSDPVTNKVDNRIGETLANRKFPWQQAFNEVLPYLRPSDVEELDPRQLSGEMFAMSQNQQEPVPLQTFQPQLTTPYDISYQDKLNENRATFRGAQRTMGYNPAAQANLAAQQYQANEGVLGEQFRANQAMKNQTYAQNRETLNQAQLRNLQAYDQQATRQSQAKSNTKEVTQAALSSISDKFMKNKLENRTLQTYENMYNYRYSPRMIAENMNPLAQFDTSVASARSQIPGQMNPEGMLPTYTSDSYGNPVKSGYKIINAKTPARNGDIVSSFKDL